jgi:hypothetical protein
VTRTSNRPVNRPGVWAAVLAAASLCLTALIVAPAGAAPAPGGSSTIGPGVQILTPVPGRPGEYAQCTANFVFRSVSYTYRAVRFRTATGALASRTVRVAHRHVYIGMAAHCVGAASNSDTSTNGCDASTGSLPLGTTVYFYQGVSGGSSLLGLVSVSNGSNGHRIGSGVLRYSSWVAMKRAHTTNAATCSYNDLALVEVNAAYLRLVNPTVPFFGGPTKLAALPGAGASIYTVGNSSLRGTERSTSGTVNSHSTWSDLVTTSDPGVPGDSGSGYMNSAGQAVGVLSTLDCSDPLCLTGKQNGIGSLLSEVAFARTHGIATLVLTPGTAAFNPARAGRPTGSNNGGGLLGGLL